MAARFHRLEALFGGPLDHVTYSDLAALVGNPDATEGADLDYKATHYTSEKKAELAKDVAALANTVGGVLVLGLADDRRSRIPAAVVPVELTDGRLRQIRQTLASNLRPTPRFELITKEDAPGSNQGILLIAVPRSMNAPHAVIEDHRLAYPRRDGDTTGWLTEAEVATAYGRRFQQLAERRNRIVWVDEEVEDTAIDLASPEEWGYDEAVMTIALVPDVPGGMVIDHATVERVRQQELSAAPLLGRGHPTFEDIRVGSRRLVLTDGQLRPGYVAELHADGSGAWAALVPLQEVTPSADDPWTWGVDTDTVVTLVLSALRHLAWHAVTRVGASGTASIRVRLESRVSYDEPRFTEGTPEWQPVHLSHDHVVPVAGEALQVGETARSSAVGRAHAVLSELADGQGGLVESAWLLIGDLFQHFGLAEPSQITREGCLVLDAWSEQERRRIHAWAVQAGVSFS